ncbi:hypothetical protein AS888_00070 [Peribacillus simplex]|uniref:Uncharacterized protein n=1 Tax=Peribacillus simplex TaxID=1478 RepID=A0A109MZH6_9BACI|nr:hypothetical protein [Peribacillus simplex]KWW20724.1 hypothetical protein AS888_00070 [Peribacillus simplex]
MFKKLLVLSSGIAISGMLALPMGEAKALSNNWSLSDNGYGFEPGVMHLKSQGTITSSFASIKYDGYASTIVMKDVWEPGTKIVCTIDGREETVTAGGDNTTLFDAVTKTSSDNGKAAVIATLNMDNTDSSKTALLSADVYAWGSISINNGATYEDNLVGVGDRGL